ncbi:MAG: universal stress protein [Candidatus Oceanisphaera merdipullorum]|nr:universal stress protein [Candidatus Oceanisphaera merdipullorum]
MSQPELSSATAKAQSCGVPTARPSVRHVLACVNGDPFADAVLSHAAAVAKALGARMTVIHVLKVTSTQEQMDPVEWTLRHYDSIEYLNACLSRFDGVHAEVVIVAGKPAERISAWANEHGADVIVLGRGGESDGLSMGLGNTARGVAQSANASVMLVPVLAANHSAIHYHKLLIPLDGACRSECPLPLGLSIAMAHKAEVVLIHAAPKIDLIEIDLLNAKAIALREQLYRHNESAARAYLDDLGARLPERPATRRRLLPSGDARRALVLATTEEQADLVVLSAAGKSGHADMTVGSVADYLINRLSIPVLLVRQHQPNLAKFHGTQCHAMDMRLPGLGMR